MRLTMHGALLTMGWLAMAMLPAVAVGGEMTAPSHPAHEVEWKRFEFPVDFADVTLEDVSLFLERYNARKLPKLLAAFPGKGGESLVVIGPPDAERALRNELLAWESVTSTMFRQRSVAEQEGALVRTRQNLYSDLAVYALAKVDLDENDEDYESKRRQLESLVAKTEQKIEKTDRKLVVIRTILTRLHAEPR